jgi:4-hydroxy-tetrahydrodipicolinate synthase
VPTPFRDDQTLDPAGIRLNVARFRALGLSGIFCNGLMGEGWSLAFDDRCNIVETTVEAAGGALPVGVVTTHGSTAETIALSRHAAACGVDHIVLMRPAGLFSSAELADLVRMVADAAACRVVLFDSDAQSGGYPPAVIRELALEGRIHAVKCTRNGDAIAALRAECGDVVSICDPYESHALANLARFDHRVLYADPEPYLYQLPDRQPISEYFACHARGDSAAMLAQHAKLEPIRRVYQRWIEAPLMRGRPINAALKQWCRRVGLAAGPVRHPLHGLDAEAAAAFNADLDHAFNAVFGAAPEALAP